MIAARVILGKHRPVRISGDHTGGRMGLTDLKVMQVVVIICVELVRDV